MPKSFLEHFTLPPNLQICIFRDYTKGGCHERVPSPEM
jgi:hypothetical protein